jgi:acyl-[acyl-carrier-protein] desaturase
VAAPTPRLSQAALLEELEPVVAAELDRHLRTAKDWYPHEYVPWSEGTDYSGPLDGQAWDPAQSQVDEVARTALVVNLLTEDNRPSYHREIDISFGRDGAWGTWVGRWTAEEARHGQAMRDYMLVTRAVDPVALEDERLAHMTAGFRSAYPHDLQHGVAYVSFQELATRISHRNTGRHTADPRFESLLARIAVDENLHMIFYRNVAAAALERDPDAMVCAVRDVVVDFAMPGANVEGYTRRALTIAMGGIYDLRIHHDEVLMPVLRAWGIWDLEGLGPAGEQARDELAAFMAGLDAQAARFVEQREARRARSPARG